MWSTQEVQIFFMAHVVLNIMEHGQVYLLNVNFVLQHRYHFIYTNLGFSMNSLQNTNSAAFQVAAIRPLLICGAANLASSWLILTWL